ncbi:MAG: polysaccharide biosynthesis protein [Ruminococcus sp.]|nr:polysaccharide biosynthesis protein [Ruminococcus sp.]
MKKQGFLLSSLILIITVIITKILGLIYKIPLTNILGGEGFGYYSVAYSVFMPMFSISVSGITQSISRLVSENAIFERYKNVRKIKRVALLFFSLIGIAFTLLTVIIALPVCVYIVKEPSSIWSVIAISPCIFIGTQLSVLRGYYEGLRNMTPTAFTEVLESCFKIVFGLGLAFWGAENCDRFFIKGLPFVSACAISGVTIANLLSCMILIIYQKIKGDGITKQMINSDLSTDRMRDLLQAILKISMPIAIAFAITTLGGFIDTLTINHSIRNAIRNSPEYFSHKFGLTFSDESLPTFIYGSYTGLTLTIFGLIPSMVSIFGKSILPVISEDMARGYYNEVSKKINSVLFITALISIPSAMGIFTFSDEILTLLFPTKAMEILACRDSLKILCAGMVFLCMSSPIYSILQAISKPKVSVRIMLTACVVKMILNYYLVSIPRLNIAGAAVAATFSYGIILLMSVYELTKVAKVKISYRKIFVKPFFASFMCVMTAKSCFDLVTMHSNFVLSLVISVFLGVIIYIFSLYLLSVLTKNEIKWLFFK